VRTISSSIIFASFVAVFAFGGTLLGAAGCGGSGGGGGSGGSGGTGGSTGGSAPACFDYSTFDGKAPAVSFKTDVLPVFQRSCGVSTSCHGDANAPNVNRPYFGPNNKTMATAADIDKIFKGVVDVVSYADPKMDIIKSGDPEHSFVMYKLDDELKCGKLSCGKDCGDHMPQGSDVLAQKERDAIRRWIAQGAQNN